MARHLEDTGINTFDLAKDAVNQGYFVEDCNITTGHLRLVAYGMRHSGGM